jgi:hypothetical protein
MHRNFLKLYIISLRVEVSLFALSPEIEGRNAVEVDKKRASTLNDIYYFIFKRITKKNEYKFTYIFIFLFLQLQFSNFKPLVIYTSLVIGT